MKIWMDEYSLGYIIDRLQQDYPNVRTENWRTNGQKVRTTSFVLRVNDSSGPGARWSGSGRRTPAACWHVHRDLYKLIFERDAGTRIQTALADYRGVEDFEQKFPDTYYSNCGSMAAPCWFGTCCECEGQAFVPQRRVPREIYPPAHARDTVDGDEVRASLADTQLALNEWDDFIAGLKGPTRRMVKR